jgi:hypothetical protein
MKQLNLVKQAILTIALGGFTLGASAAEIKNVQQAMVSKCAQEIMYFKVADQATANKLCSCTTQVQADNLKLGEFWGMQTAAVNGTNPDTLPQIKRIQPKLQQCRVGLKLNNPQAPARPAAK